ncbi:Transcription factor vib-1 [Paramyrothecium foliicola]|nr:Transcription factor vib-1 [Paramyrothecium foliicola]
MTELFEKPASRLWPTHDEGPIYQALRRNTRPDGPGTTMTHDYSHPPNCKTSIDEVAQHGGQFQEIVQDLREDGSRLTMNHDHKLLAFRQSQHKHTIVNQDGQTKLLEISAQLHGMFFLPEMPADSSDTLTQELTCYRRNLFQISGSLISPREEIFIVNEADESIPISGIEVQVSAIESLNANPVRLIIIPWKTPPPNTPEASQNPDLEPPSLPLDRLGEHITENGKWVVYPIGWRRLQFRIATANNGRRKELQQNFVIHLKVLGTLNNGAKVILTESASPPIVVRGRSPRNFRARKEVPLFGSGSAAKTPAEHGLDFESKAKIMAANQLESASTVSHPKTASTQLSNLRLESDRPSEIVNGKREIVIKQEPDEEASVSSTNLQATLLSISNTKSPHNIDEKHLSDKFRANIETDDSSHFTKEASSESSLSDVSASTTEIPIEEKKMFILEQVLKYTAQWLRSRFESQHRARGQEQESNHPSNALTQTKRSEDSSKTRKRKAGESDEDYGADKHHTDVLELELRRDFNVMEESLKWKAGDYVKQLISEAFDEFRNSQQPPPVEASGSSGEQAASLLPPAGAHEEQPWDNSPWNETAELDFNMSFLDSATFLESDFAFGDGSLIDNLFQNTAPNPKGNSDSGCRKCLRKGLVCPGYNRRGQLQWVGGPAVRGRLTQYQAPMAEQRRPDQPSAVDDELSLFRSSLDYRWQQLMDYYDRHVCKLLVWVDTRDNVFRKFVLPLTEKSLAVKLSVAAVSEQYAATLQGTCVFSEDARDQAILIITRHVTEITEKIATGYSIDDYISSGTAEWMLASMLVLSCYEMAHSGASAADIHRKAARSLVSSLSSTECRNSMLFASLRNKLATYEIFAATTSFDLDNIQEVILPISEAETPSLIEPGLFSDFLVRLHRVTLLARQPHLVGESSCDWRTEFESARGATLLMAGRLQITPDQCSDLIRLADIHYNAAILYLYRSIRNGMDHEVETAFSDLTRQLLAFQNVDAWVHNLPWPVFILGVESYGDKKVQGLVTDLYDRIFRVTKLKHYLEVVEFLRAFWSGNAPDWEMVAQSREFLGKPILAY